MNNKKIAVITDSCADLPKEIKEKDYVFVLPMVIQCMDGEHKEGVDIEVEDIYELQKTELPKTSTPTGDDIIKTLEQIKKDGFEQVIAVILSSGLSGSYNQFCLLSDDVDGLEIAAFDSKTASAGIGSIITLLTRYMEEHGDALEFEQAKAYTEHLIQNQKVFFAVDTLEFLVKGGRIGKAAGFAGSILDIKPILSFDEDGVIYSPSKVRGQKKVESKLVSLIADCMEEYRGHRFYLIFADGGVPEAKKSLENALKERCPGYLGTISAKVGATLSVHLGRGVLGAGYVLVD